MSSIPIIGANGHGKSQDCVRVLRAILDDAKAGKVSSIALIVIDGPGAYRVVGAGTDVDGLYEGSIALFTQLDKLMSIAEDAEKPKVARLDA